MTARETAEEIEEAAARWVWRLDQDHSAADLHQELERWLAGDPRRQGAFLRAQATMSVLNGVSPATAAPRRAQRALRARLSRRAVIASGSAIAAGIGGLIVWSTIGQSYQTAVGEIRRVPLKDGSEVAMNTHTALTVALKSKLRTIHLKEGEAWFQVAKDADRPFVVDAGKVRVRAVGTAFSVRVMAGGAEVQVTEGVVEAWTDGAEGHTVRLSAGESAFIADNAAIEQQSAAPSEVDRKLAWREGKIDLRGESLADAVADFNRYNDRQLVIADPAIAKAPLYGVFRTDDPVGFATAVHAALKIGVATRADGTIALGENPAS